MDALVSFRCAGRARSQSSAAVGTNTNTAAASAFGQRSLAIGLALFGLALLVPAFVPPRGRTRERLSAVAQAPGLSASCLGIVAVRAPFRIRKRVRAKGSFVLVPPATAPF